MTETVITSKGIVAVSTFTKEDSLKKSIKDLPSDIYKNLQNFNEDIIFISKVKPIKENTIADVLKEFLENNSNYKDKLIFSQSGILSIIKVMGNINEGLSIVNDEKENLIKAGFKNIIWNLRMSKVSGNGDYFIYNNAKGENFIRENTGDNDFKIINRVS